MQFWKFFLSFSNFWNLGGHIYRDNQHDKIILEKQCPIIFKIWLVKFRIFSFRVVYLTQYAIPENKNVM